MDAQLATLTAAITSVFFMMAPSPRKKPTPSPMVKQMQEINRHTQDVARHLGITINERPSPVGPDSEKK
jgi:hypothetical protein